MYLHFYYIQTRGHIKTQRETESSSVTPSFAWMRTHTLNTSKNILQHRPRQHNTTLLSGRSGGAHSTSTTLYIIYTHTTITPCAAAACHVPWCSHENRKGVDLEHAAERTVYYARTRLNAACTNTLDTSRKVCGGGCLLAAGRVFSVFIRFVFGSTRVLDAHTHTHARA